MNLFISGSSGFLGRHLLKRLMALGHEITAPDSDEVDLRRQDSLNACNSTTFDIIYHLASWTQAGDFCLHHPAEQWIVNQQLNTNIISWWQRSQPQAKLVTIGTSCAYDPRETLIEENYLRGEPISSLLSYAMTKRMLYLGQMEMNRQYGSSYYCLVPSTMYGSGYHTDQRQMHFIFDLIRKILRGKMYAEAVTLWGDGYQCRELIHVGDFTRAMIELTLSGENELVNVGGGVEFPIRHFASEICKIVDYDEKLIRYDPLRHVGAKSKCLNTEKFKRLLPNIRFIPLQEGLEETISWFIANRDTTLS